MATTVESPGITSAKEEAAAILYARQPQTIAAKPLIEENVDILPENPVQKKSTRPNFASYHNPEPMPVHKSVDTIQFKPYKTFDEVKVESEPQVIRPYIDSSDYLSSAVASTTVSTPATTEVVKQTVAQVSAPTSVFDTELEEDTQYVVKFKNSTIVAATIIATIFLLMSILCIVNIVSLFSTSAQVNALMEESTSLQQTLNQERSNLEQTRQTVDSSTQSNTRNVHYVANEGNTAVVSNAASDSSFFDWLCHSLSNLFS